jgi:hypothetical protein
LAISWPNSWNAEEAVLGNLTDIIIALTDLAEAEGRELKRAVFRTGWGLAFMLVMGLLVAAGLGMCLWAGYQYLVTQVGTIEAALLAGGSALLVAGVFAWLAIRFSR